MAKIFIYILSIYISNVLSSEMLSQTTHGATVHHQHYKDTIGMKPYYQESLLSLK
jgi:hypothetical protein